jgi:hypothetical protein
MKLLLEFFKNIDLKDGRNDALLYRALSTAESIGNPDVISLFLEYDAVNLDSSQS